MREAIQLSEQLGQVLAEFRDTPVVRSSNRRGSPNKEMIFGLSWVLIIYGKKITCGPPFFMMAQSGFAQPMKKGRHFRRRPDSKTKIHA
jgi:hypothetical protein